MDVLLTSDESDVEISSSRTNSEDSDELLLEENDAVGDVWQEVEAGQDIGGGNFGFTGIAGVHPGIELPENVEDVNFFLRLFISDELLNSITEWTNEKAWAEVRMATADGEELPNVLHTWKDATRNEISKLLGMYMFMGISRKPELHDYWSTQGVHTTPFFQSAQALTRDRFKQVLTYMRFYDVRQQDESDPLRKIRPLMNLTQQICSSVYQPEQQISIDESLILYKGRLSFRQYIPSKRARVGIKMYCTCESASGYLCNFLVHSTAEENARFGDGLGCGQLSLSEKIVVDLSKNLLNFGYHIFVDKWFTSARLAAFLFERATFLTGTVRADRGVPVELRQRQVPVNDVAFMRQQSLLAMKIVERKESGVKTFFMLDTHGSAQKMEMPRIRKNGQIIQGSSASPGGIR